MVNNPSSDAIGDTTLSPSFKYLFLLLQFAQVPPFMIPFLFSFIRYTASSACLLYAYLSSSGFNGITTGFIFIAPSYNFFDSFIISAISLSPNRFIYLFACICINITFTAACMYACLFLLFVTQDYFIFFCICFSMHVSFFVGNGSFLLALLYESPSMLDCNNPTYVPVLYIIVLHKSLSSLS